MNDKGERKVCSPTVCPEFPTQKQTFNNTYSETSASGPSEIGTRPLYKKKRPIPCTFSTRLPKKATTAGFIILLSPMCPVLDVSLYFHTDVYIY